MTSLQNNKSIINAISNGLFSYVMGAFMVTPFTTGNDTLDDGFALKESIFSAQDSIDNAIEGIAKYNLNMDDITNYLNKSRAGLDRMLGCMSDINMVNKDMTKALDKAVNAAEIALDKVYEESDKASRKLKLKQAKLKKAKNNKESLEYEILRLHVANVNTDYARIIVQDSANAVREVNKEFTKLRIH